MRKLQIMGSGESGWEKQQTAGLPWNTRSCSWGVGADGTQEGKAQTSSCQAKAAVTTKPRAGRSKGVMGQYFTLQMLYRKDSPIKKRTITRNIVYSNAHKSYNSSACLLWPRFPHV